MEEDVNETPRLSRSTTGKKSALCCTRVGIDSGSDGLWRRQRLTITIAASINNFYQHKPRHRGRASGRNSDLYSDGKVLGSAGEWNYIADNPARKTQPPRREYKQERPILAPAQVWRLVIALQEPARSVALLLALTGLRIGELLALRWKSVDLGAQTLRVTATVYEEHFDTPKTKRSVRAIPLGPKTLSVLTVLHKSAHDPNDLVFSTRSGEPLCRTNLLHRHLQSTCNSLVCQECLGTLCVSVTPRCWTLRERR